MNQTIFGIIGLTLGIIAIITGVIAISNSSYLIPGAYLLISIIAGLLVTRFFCSSCPIKDTCVHILPGRIAGFWKVTPGPYTTGTLLLTIFLFAVILLPPQYALVSFPVLFLIFWICIGIAVICSHRFLCPGCGNRFCPFRR